MTNNPVAQPDGVAGAPADAAWREWFDVLARATGDVVNATASLVIAERDAVRATSDASVTEKAERATKKINQQPALRGCAACQPTTE